MTKLEGLSLGITAYSLLFWLYIAIRIIYNGVDPRARFIDQIPYLTFYGLGSFLFAVSFISFMIYVRVK